MFRFKNLVRQAALSFSAAMFGLISAPVVCATQNADDSNDRPVITVGVMDTMVNPFDAFLIQETLEALQTNLPEYEIRSVTLVAAETDTQIKNIQPDFIFAPGGQWLTNVSHARVDALFKDLELGPYAYLRDMSLKGLY